MNRLFDLLQNCGDLALKLVGVLLVAAIIAKTNFFENTVSLVAPSRAYGDAVVVALVVLLVVGYIRYRLRRSAHRGTGPRSTSQKRRIERD